jgi:hypothetical protein
VPSINGYLISESVRIRDGDDPDVILTVGGEVLTPS